LAVDKVIATIHILTFLAHPVSNDIYIPQKLWSLLPGENWTGNISRCSTDAVTTEPVVTVSKAPIGRRETPPVTTASFNPSRHSPTSASQQGDFKRQSSTPRKPRPQAVELVSRQQPPATVVG